MHVFVHFANLIQSDFLIKLAVSLLLSMAILFNYKRFLFWIIFLPYSGIVLYSKFNPRDFMFINSYVEITLVLLFFVHYFKHFDKTCWYIIIMVFTAAISFINSSGHCFLSSFLFLCLLGGAGVYMFFKEEMRSMLEKKLIDKTLLVLLALGIFIKFYTSARTGESVIVQRGGGILGSNHIALPMILLLPFAGSRWIYYSCLIFLSLQFSRGIYLAILFNLLVSYFFLDRKEVRRTVIILLAFFVILISLLMTQSVVGCDGKFSFYDFFLSRFRCFSPGTHLSFGNFLSGNLRDPRFSLFSSAAEIFTKSNLLGIGLGGFSWGLQGLGYPEEFLYTNSHNVFLTSFAEGGILFGILFLVFLIVMLYRSFIIDKKIFLSIATWTFYCLYSGQIYEVGGFATAGDFYFLLFVLALLKYKSDLGINDAKRTIL